MIRSVYRSSKGDVSQNLTPEQIQAALQDKTGTLWIDFVHTEASKDQATALLRDVFHFHPLSVDDALNEAHVPRLDDWDEYVYIVLHALDLEINRTLDSEELDVFLGPNYLVTLRTEVIKAVNHVWEQCQRGADKRLASGPDHLLYSLCDAITGDFMAIVDGLDDEIDELEKEVFHRPTPRTISRIFRVRRTILKLRRILGYLREVMNRLARDDYKVVDEHDRVYFRDVYDHLVRLYDVVEGLRDMAAGALDSYLSVSSNRINQVMRTLTVVTVLFMPVSFLAGFFGMNFFGEDFGVRDPFTGDVFFLLCMALMVATPLLMLWWMSRRGWLRSIVRQENEDDTNT